MSGVEVMPENMFVLGRVTGAEMLAAGIETLAEIEPPIIGAAMVVGGVK
jgi:hypothetical protein